MIPDLDIYRSANVLVKRHGAGALSEAADAKSTPLIEQKERPTA